MLVSQKCRYALRAVFELALRYGKGPVKVSEIAEAQAIPPKFLEVILNQLKQGGFVESRRGNVGGYLLSRQPGKLTVGEVIYFMQGPVNMVDCLEGSSQERCPLWGKCVFLPMWQKAQEAISGVYDNTTFEELVDQFQVLTERQSQQEQVPCYTI